MGLLASLTRPRGVSLTLAAATAVAVAGCAGEGSPEADHEGLEHRRAVVVDRGAPDVVDLRPVTVQAAPGDVVVLRSANPGNGEDDESPVHHLFTSATPDTLPPLFTRTGAGHVPNGGVWGLCRGGQASGAANGCPVPPVDGPQAYDGRSYFSLGALLPGEERELPLDEDLALGTYRFTCALHPELHVDVEVVEDPQPSTALPTLDAELAVRRATDRQMLGTSGTATVVLAPLLKDPTTEVLAAVPERVQVPVGGTVVWRVPGRSPHTVELGLDAPPHLADTTPADTVPLVPETGSWDGRGTVRSGILSADPSVARQEFALTFTRPGRYRAYDRFHAGISTLVEVR